MRAAMIFWIGMIPVLQAAEPLLDPLLRVVDLDVGETTEVRLCNGESMTVRLLDMDERRCELRGAVRRSRVTLELDGAEVKVPCSLYRLPRTVGRVQVDCPVTRGYTRGSSKANVWALDKDARIRLWPAGSPWVRPGSMGYPVEQRWFASDTQMANEPCYVNACDVPGKEKVYYHYGLDFGGVEGMVPVLAATDGVVVSRAGKLMAGDYPPQVKPRGDVVYIRDDRGWYYRYSHLQSIAPSLGLGARVRLGEKVGVLGKEGGSGGWAHLHFDVSMPQPSGRYGIADGFAFIWQAYRERHGTRMMASARPHTVAWAGEPVGLDAGASWHADGREKITRYFWALSDGTKLLGARATRRYAKPGHYTETLWAMDDAGNSAVDFAVVQVFDREKPLPVPPAIHAAYWPTFGLKPGDEVTFKARTFAVRPNDGEEAWDFGDGSPVVMTRSDGNARQHNPDGYAVTTHRYAKAGDYIVTVQRTNARGQTATGKLWVRVGEGGEGETQNDER
jgi:hypothetical protein